MIRMPIPITMAITMAITVFYNYLSQKWIIIIIVTAIIIIILLQTIKIKYNPNNSNILIKLTKNHHQT